MRKRRPSRSSQRVPCHRLMLAACLHVEQCMRKRLPLRSTPVIRYLSPSCAVHETEPPGSRVSGDVVVFILAGLVGGECVNDVLPYAALVFVLAGELILAQPVVEEGWQALFQIGCGPA